MDHHHKHLTNGAGPFGDVRLPSREVLRESGQVQSLSRALRLLNALSYSSHGMSLSEVATEVGLPTSTAHRLLTTLQNERFVRFDQERSRWLVGVQAFQVGSAFFRSRDLVALARPFMRRLAEQSGETVNLSILDRAGVVCLAEVECGTVIRATLRPGCRTSLRGSAAGRILLAFMPEGEATMHAGPDPISADLKKELAAILARGYAVDDEESAIGLRCVSGPVFDEYGSAMAGLSISGPAARIPEHRLAVLGRLVAAVAAEVTQEVGGRAP